MKKLVILVVEDEKLVRELLISYIREILGDMQVDIITSSTFSLAKQLIQTNQPELVFLDIRLQDANSFEQIEELNIKDFKLVFTTAYSEHMADSINNLGCFGYLLKPMSLQSVKTIFDRFFAERALPEYKKITLKIANKQVLVSENEIIYCQADNNYCNMFFKGEKQLFTKTLKEFEKTLSPDLFVRAHRSYLVNKNYIKSFDAANNKILVEVDDVAPIEIPVSESHRKKVSELF
ncbi:LytTR family DNA-binding domain-containing protein [Flavobacterium agricola]|uniref:LytTR family DNA-binding domain-containing protein n=1 Tax=Flavobacterium agricola TaxID=2870839 RepID=A0ABY6M3D1_9FLAO|nr:LytTR family DNA-binding domain-containing protein [Flavobacterium agricola]UYW01716.1 LytTR family DNA-binding domain-containing protein [Flavobacterium agricola]